MQIYALSIIRPLRKEQLPKYAHVIRQSFATVAIEFCLTRENCPRHTSFITDERLADKYKDGYYPFGLFAKNDLIGFVSLTHTGDGVYSLENLAVLPEWRHHGYGKQLLDFCKDKVLELGGRKITIGIVEEHTDLKNWYASNGFTHVGTKRFDGLPFTAGFMEWENRSERRLHTADETHV